MCSAILILYVSSQGNQPASSLISDLQEQEMTLKQCIEQLESVDMARVSLINQLKQALSEQVLSLFIIFPTFNLNYLVLFRTICFFFFITGVEVSSSSRSIASKNSSLYLIACCPFHLLLFLAKSHPHYDAYLSCPIYSFNLF